MNFNQYGVDFHGQFFIGNQKSILFHAPTASNLIRNPKLYIIFPPETLITDTQSLNLEKYGQIFNQKSKKRIISRLNGQQFDTQSEIAYYFLA